MPADAHVESPRLIGRLVAGNQAVASMLAVVDPRIYESTAPGLEDASELQVRLIRDVVENWRDAEVFGDVRGIPHDEVVSRGPFTNVLREPANARARPENGADAPPDPVCLIEVIRVLAQDAAEGTSDLDGLLDLP